VYIYVYTLVVVRYWLGEISPLVASQRLGKNFTVATNTHATIEKSLDVSFSMRSVSYQGK
jgi:hypothetical protein